MKRGRPEQRTPADIPSEAERVWQVVALIPRGRVATYGQVALLAGLPNGARKVGRIMSCLPRGSRIPWHRVVNAGGRISLPSGSAAHARQRSRLEREGIRFSNGRLSLRVFRWNP